MNIADLYAVVSDMRKTLALPALTIDSRLEYAASKHANYLYLNKTISHTEVAGNPGFYGKTLEDRYAAVGYPELSGDEGAAPTSDVAAGFEGLLSVPYHAMGFFEVGAYHMGLGVAGTSGGAGGLVFDLGSTSYQYTTLPKDTISIYPCAMSGIPRKSIADEGPAPFPGRNLRSDPIGSVIIMQIPYAQGNSWSPGSITLQEKISKTVSPLLEPAKYNYDTTNMRIYTAAKPLKPMTYYSISVAGFLNGVAYQRSCDFITGG
jgi:hypothetical protein